MLPDFTGSKSIHQFHRDALLAAIPFFIHLIPAWASLQLSSFRQLGGMSGYPLCKGGERTVGARKNLPGYKLSPVAPSCNLTRESSLLG